MLSKGEDHSIDPYHMILRPTSTRHRHSRTPEYLCKKLWHPNNARTEQITIYLSVYLLQIIYNLYLPFRNVTQDLYAWYLIVRSNPSKHAINHQHNTAPPRNMIEYAEHTYVASGSYATTVCTLKDLPGISFMSGLICLMCHVWKNDARA